MSLIERIRRLWRREQLHAEEHDQPVPSPGIEQAAKNWSGIFGQSLRDGTDDDA